MLSVLLIDDNDRFRDVLAEYLRCFGILITERPSWSDSWALICLDLFDIVVTDLVMDEGLALSQIGRMQRDFPKIPIVVLTGYNSSHVLGVDDKGVLSSCSLITKGGNLSEIRCAINLASFGA